MRCRLGSSDSGHPPSSASRSGRFRAGRPASTAAAASPQSANSASSPSSSSSHTSFKSLLSKVKAARWIKPIDLESTFQQSERSGRRDDGVGVSGAAAAHPGVAAAATPLPMEQAKQALFRMRALALRDKSLSHDAGGLPSELSRLEQLLEQVRGLSQQEIVSQTWLPLSREGD